MGRLKVFEVFLSNTKGVYFAGQRIEGSVVVELTDVMKTRGIRLKFKGEATVYWTENKDDNEKETYTTKETYFENEMLVTGQWKRSSGNRIALAAGRHIYPFAYQLPSRIPSSFESSMGIIRYTVKATIDRPWDFNHKTMRAFTVICLFELNKEPYAAMPTEGSNRKEICCLCCRSGSVQAHLLLDRRGYVPGEAIIIKAQIDNNSTRKIRSSSVVLTMKIDYHVGAYTSIVSLQVAKLKHGEIVRGETDYWNGDKLFIPPLPPSFLPWCSIIDINYTLTLRVEPSGPAIVLAVPLEVIVGTIPLLPALPQEPPLPPPSGSPMVMPTPSSKEVEAHCPPTHTPGRPQGPEPPALLPVVSSYPQMPGIPNMPKPLFRESAFSRFNAAFKDDKLDNWNPLYPHYMGQWPPPQQA